MKEEKIQKLIAQSSELYRAGAYDKTEKLCRKILHDKPAEYTTLLNIGNALFQNKKYQEAKQYYAQADSLYPNDKLIKINLANALLQCEEYAAAEKKARQLLKSDSQNYAALNILGTALLEQENFDEALAILNQALQQNNQDAWLYNYLSRCYQAKGQNKEALAAGWQAIKLSPTDENQHINFGYMLYELSLDSDAKIIKEYAAKWLHDFPENKMAKHMGNAIVNQSIPDKADGEYIKEIFDIFAPDFEKVLADLEYQTPQKIGQILLAIYGKDSHPRLHILDAGCGTGLCGKYLKPYAGFFALEGVDLSEEMLKKAKAKKIYNRLYCNDIVEFLQKRKTHYDLIVAADVFTYFGRLDSLFAQMQKSLYRGGRILFSITSNDETDSPYVLHISGRYKHHKNYVEEVLQKNGFLVEKEEACCLRKEALQEVKGYIISAIKA